MIESLNNFYNGNWPFNCTIIDEVCSQPIQNWKNFIATKITPNKSVRNLESIIVVRAIQVLKNIKLRDVQIFTIACFLISKKNL